MPRVKNWKGDSDGLLAPNRDYCFCIEDLDLENSVLGVDEYERIRIRVSVSGMNYSRHVTIFTNKFEYFLPACGIPLEWWLNEGQCNIAPKLLVGREFQAEVQHSAYKNRAGEERTDMKLLNFKPTPKGQLALDAFARKNNIPAVAPQSVAPPSNFQDDVPSSQNIQDDLPF